MDSLQNGAETERKDGKYSDAVFILADITGYTRFLRLHVLSKYHAEELVAEIIEELIDAAGDDLKLSKIEGDAVFFYLPLAETSAKLAELLSDQFVRFFKVFQSKVSELLSRRLCICDACSSVDQLNLKVVAHKGGVYFREIKGMRELAGPDVILAHRLLKNSLPKRPYVLKTKSLYELLGDSWPFPSQRHVESYPEFEKVELYVTYLDPLSAQSESSPPGPPRMSQKLSQFSRIFWRGLLLQLGLKQSYRKS